MEISAHAAVMTAMWRFHDAALERATLIHTFARSTMEDTPQGFTIYGRQLTMLIDLVHEFCFYARRAIERAEKHSPGIIARISSLKIHGEKRELILSKLDCPNSLGLTQESFWWVLGRIIHSKDTQVICNTLKIVITDGRTGRHHTVRQPVAFGFSSDRDGERDTHYIELESFVTHYFGSISHQIERAIHTRNYPLAANQDA